MKSIRIQFFFGEKNNNKNALKLFFTKWIPACCVSKMSAKKLCKFLRRHKIWLWGSHCLQGRYSYSPSRHWSKKTSATEKRALLSINQIKVIISFPTSLVNEICGSKILSETRLPALNLRNCQCLTEH